VGIRSTRPPCERSVREIQVVLDVSFTSLYTMYPFSLHSLHVSYIECARARAGGNSLKKKNIERKRLFFYLLTRLYFILLFIYIIYTYISVDNVVPTSGAEERRYFCCISTSGYWQCADNGYWIYDHGVNVEIPTEY
jgi:hypothetical protein